MTESNHDEKTNQLTPNRLDEIVVPPSDEFIDAVGDSGSVCLDCDLCGRMHFATLDLGCYEKGELEDLEAKAEAQPDKYIAHHDSHTIYGGRINGQSVVIGCECNKLRRFEDWIWSHRYIISKYLKARADKEVKDAQYQKEALGGL